jgi:hypothetical protein
MDGLFDPNAFVITFPVYFLGKTRPGGRRDAAVTVLRGRSRSGHALACVFTDDDLAGRFLAAHPRFRDFSPVPLRGRRALVEFLDAIQSEGCTHVGFDDLGRGAVSLAIADVKSVIERPDGGRREHRSAHP